LRSFGVDVSEFKEPNAKNEPELKEPELKTCPNCGVIIENG
jgi:hypothetical protein